MNTREIGNFCRDHNTTFCPVRYINSYQPEIFLEDLRGNLLITGGFAEKRRELLVRAVVSERQKSTRPVIILSESSQLEKQLIEKAKQGQIGKMVVCSRTYKDYAFFQNMGNNEIVNFFSEVADIKGYRDAGSLCDFLEAFLNILRRRSDVNLATMLEFAKNSDTLIANAAEKDSTDYESIMASAQGGKNFRTLLSNVAKSFFSITTRTCNSGMNILSELSDDCVFFINISEIPAYEFLSVYFLQELKSATNREFSIIFDDTLLLNNIKLSEHIHALKQKENIRVIISDPNILSFPYERAAENFKKQIYLLNGSMPPTDMQKLLSSHGNYDHFEEVGSISEPPNLIFSLEKSRSSSVTVFSRPKLLFEELTGYSAILSGNNGPELLAVKKI